jgi:hypothetical protein
LLLPLLTKAAAATPSHRCQCCYTDYYLTVLVVGLDTKTMDRPYTRQMAKIETFRTNNKQQKTSVHNFIIYRSAPHHHHRLCCQPIRRRRRRRRRRRQRQRLVYSAAVAASSDGVGVDTGIQSKAAACATAATAGKKLEEEEQAGPSIG